MKYDVEADWKLLNTCNFRCSYCFISPELLGGKMRVAAGPQAWRSAFERTGKTWLLHLTGGEPSLYIDFVELCRALTETHYISLNSNLSGRAIAAFADIVDPTRVSFINAGLHLEERESRGAHRSFVQNAAALKSRGFPIFVSLVATPSALRRFDEAAALLAPVGLFPAPKLLRERFEGQTYPDAYTDEDKALFRSLAIAAREAYWPFLTGIREAPSIDVFDDDELLGGEPSYVGRSCAAGSRFISIEPDGEVFRCSAKTRLGNLLDGSFEPLPGPAACDTRFCPYWCRKYAEPMAA